MSDPVVSVPGSLPPLRGHRSPGCPAAQLRAAVLGGDGAAEHGGWRSGAVDGRPVAVLELPAPVGTLAPAGFQPHDGPRLPVISVLGDAGPEVPAAPAAAALAAVSAPHVAVVVGTVTGPLAVVAGLADVRVLVRGAVLACVAPAAVTRTTGEPVTAAALGGAHVHAARTGSAEVVVDDGYAAAAVTAELMSLLDPADHRDVGPAVPGWSADGALATVTDQLRRCTDGGRLLALAPDTAPNLVTALARVDGWPVGVLATRSGWRGGALDLAATRKAARFVRTCTRRGLPLVRVLEADGVVASREDEHQGLVAELAALVAALTEHQAAGLPSPVLRTGPVRGAAELLALPGAVADAVVVGAAPGDASAAEALRWSLRDHGWAPT